MLELYFVILGGVAVALGLVSRPLREAPVTEPLIVLAAGVLFGPQVLDVVDLPTADREQILMVASELSVAFAVMATTLRFTLEGIRQRLAGLVLLLTGGLVVMAGVTGLLAGAFLAVPAASALLLGAMLAPTDPVLASNAVSGKPAERDLRLQVRLLVSIEAAGNNGTAHLLVVVGATAVAGASQLTEIGVGLGQVAIGTVAGVVPGWVAGRLVLLAERYHEMEHSAFLVLTLSLTLFVLGVAELLGGSAVLAVFAAGLAYSHEISDAERREEWRIQEAVNRYLVLPVFALLGVALPWDEWRDLGWRGVAFVVSVLVLRRVPLLVALGRPLGLSRTEAVFTGWFGPVGVATLYYLATAVKDGTAGRTLWAAGTLAVAVSTLLHGVTAAAGRRQLGRHS